MCCIAARTLNHHLIFGIRVYLMCIERLRAGLPVCGIDYRNGTCSEVTAANAGLNVDDGGMETEPLFPPRPTPLSSKTNDDISSAELAVESLLRIAQGVVDWVGKNLDTDRRHSHDVKEKIMIHIKSIMEFQAIMPEILRKYRFQPGITLDRATIDIASFAFMTKGEGCPRMSSPSVELFAVALMMYDNGNTWRPLRHSISVSDISKIQFKGHWLGLVWDSRTNAKVANPFLHVIQNYIRRNICSKETRDMYGALSPFALVLYLPLILPPSPLITHFDLLSCYLESLLIGT